MVLKNSHEIIVIVNRAEEKKGGGKKRKGKYKGTMMDLCATKWGSHADLLNTRPL